MIHRMTANNQGPWVVAIRRLGTILGGLFPARETIVFDAESFTIVDEPDVLTTASDGAQTVGRSRIGLVSGVALQLSSATPAKVRNAAGTAGSASTAAPSDHAHQIDPATTTSAGSLSAADKTKLNSLTSGAAVAAVTGRSPIVVSAGDSPEVSIAAADDMNAGSMSDAHFSLVQGSTDSNTPDTLMRRDTSGDFAAQSALLNGAVVNGNGKVVISGSTLAIIPEPVTSASSVALDGKTGGNTKTIIAAHNITFLAPTNFDNGADLTVEVEQDSTGLRTVAWAGVFVFPSGIIDSIIGTAEFDVDVFMFKKRSTYWYCVGHTKHVKP